MPSVGFDTPWGRNAATNAQTMTAPPHRQRKSNHGPKRQPSRPRRAANAGAISAVVARTSPRVVSVMADPELESVEGGMDITRICSDGEMAGAANPADSCGYPLRERNPVSFDPGRPWQAPPSFR